jgi:hypothetical protein
MSLFADLARLRPMMPRSALSDIVGAQWQPSPRGELTLGLSFTARIDVEDLIGAVEFGSRFPSTTGVEGLRIGMPLDALLASGHAFTPAGKPNDYTVRTASGDELNVRLGAGQRIHNLEMKRPGRIYPKGGFEANAGRIDVVPASYGASNDMLLDWAAQQTFHQKHADFLTYAEWLIEQQAPDQLYGVVCEYNWGYGIEPLLWVIRQPTCDKATALTVFYLTRPGQMLDGENVRDRDALYLVEEIRRRFLAGFYTQSTIAFDAEHALRYESYLPDDADQAVVDRVIPPAMRVSLAGRDPSQIACNVPWIP